MECKCAVPCSISEISIDKTEKSEEIVAERTTFDFGSVLLGQSVRKVFEIKNETNNELEYTVSRDPDSNLIYQTYDFHYTRIVPKKLNFKCVIWYKPSVENWCNIDSLNIQDETGKRYKLILKGFCLGTSIQISSNELKFIANSFKPTDSQTIELQNEGTIPAKFKLDVKCNTIGHFKVNVTHGVVEVGNNIYIKITFEPKSFGVYYNDLFLLTLYTKPKRISLIGYYTNDPVQNEQDLVFKMYHVPVSCKTGFVGYLNDVVEICESPPLFSLTETSLDFGGMEIKKQDQTRTLVTSLTNNMTGKSIMVLWDEDPQRIFDINPRSVTIPPSNSVLLECSFKPKEPDRFYDFIMSGRVFWTDTRDDNRDILVPLCIYLRMLGSSFPKNKSWIPQLSYPEKVIVKPTLPNAFSHGTFELRITGQLPVSYRFVPPKNSRFTLKPNQGVVLNNEIIIIQFTSVDLNDNGCIERWALILNGRAEHCHFIFFSCYAENPKLLINKDNTIVFENVLPGCYDIQPVVFKNISVHYMMFRLLIPDINIICFNKNEGILVSNEEMTLHCKGSSLPGGACHSEFNIELMRYGIIGPPDIPVTMTVRTKIKSIYGELCALPSVMDLGSIRVGQSMTAEFDLYNFGESRIHSILMIHPDKGNRLKKYIEFTKETNNVAPGEHKNVGTTINCEENGDFEFNVCYKVRVHEKSMETLDIEPKNLIKIIVKVEYPSIQVVSILDYTHGECFSKAILWKMLNLTKFNHELKYIKKGETQTIEMFLPDNEISEEPFSVTLVLQNQSLFDLKVGFKRNKLCDCPIISVDKSLSFRKQIYDCRHRNLLEATLSDYVFTSDDTQTLRLTVNYEHEENVTMSYILQLSEERTLIMYFNFRILGAEVDFPSKYETGNKLLLPPVALNEKDPACIPLHFYNQSSNIVKLGLDETKLDPTRYDRGYLILKCINPEVVKIPPSKMYSLIFQFQPIEYKKYNTLLKLKMGSNEVKLPIISTGINQINEEQSTYEMCVTKPGLPEGGVSYSMDYVKIIRLLTWSCTEFIVFIKNNTEDVIGYSMKRNWIEGMIAIRSINNKGILKPQQEKPIVIYIETFDMPLKTNMLFIGKYLNHTKYFKHRKSKLEYNIKQELIKEEFTINENGEEVHEENDIVIEPMPKSFYKSITLGLNVISIFDVDLHMTAEEQLKQSPQYLLQLNENRALASLLSNETECPVPVVAKRTQQRKNVDCSGDFKEQQQPNVSEPYSNVNFLKDTIECLLMTALESKLFKKSLETHQLSDPPYYIQFQVGEDVHYTKADLTKVATVKEDLNPCPGPEVASIFRNLLIDGLHHVMHLGPPSGKGNEKDYIFDKKFKSQFTTSNE